MNRLTWTWTWTWIGAGLCLYLPAGLLGAAQLRIETHLEPASGAVAGQTLQLQVDVLTDSWFTAAPQLPALEVANAVVTPPSGEARHLNLSRDGVQFVALRYSYWLTPTRPGAFVVPALSIAVTPTQTVQSQALNFAVTQPAGVPIGQSVLVARAVSLSQTLEPSSSALQVGDSVRRQVTLSADGAQLMLLPAVPLAEVDGLRRYLDAPQLKALDDGRGQISGAQRSDGASYVIQRQGDFALPAIELSWWDSDAHRLRSAQLPALTFKARAAAARSTPWSVREDLDRLGQHGRIALSRHWLLWSLWALAAAALLYAARPGWRRARKWLQHQREQRRQRWLASPRQALQQVPGQLRGQPPRLDALYLWVRRTCGSTGLAPLRERLPIGLSEALYGRQPHAAQALQQLLRSPALKPDAGQSAAGKDVGGLQPLNPRFHPRSTALPDSHQASTSWQRRQLK
ncbi:hypothetical protein SFA35_15740 [Pseudomonas sp. HR96]|uniref:BatD family protein n=1 Tax=Pseudomonas sp. HR96 TaxID=1027966 RepID=UPI002A7518BC|nr:hypothetical protein [Pseudomonas sp. HR96]WPO98100.1 hypothetical protein SFA35_15740 [Pseudomonas sp. HR96]